MLYASLAHIPRDPATDPRPGDKFELPNGSVEVKVVQTVKDDTRRIEYYILTDEHDETRTVPLNDFTRFIGRASPIYIAGYRPQRIPTTTSEYDRRNQIVEDNKLLDLEGSSTFVPTAFGPVAVAALVRELRELRQKVGAISSTNVAGSN